MGETEPAPNRIRRKRATLAIVLIGLALSAAAILIYLRYEEFHVSTDDAFVDGRVHAIAAKVPGTVNRLLVEDNQSVRTGDLLVELDPRDYAVRRDGARADLDNESAKLSEIHHRVEAAQKQLKEAAAALESGRANVELQKANLQQTQLDLSRAEALWKGGSYSKETYDRTRTAFEVAQAQLKVAESQVRQAEAAVETQTAVIGQVESTIPTQEAVVRQKESALRAAELNLSYTRVLAPADGHVTRRSVEVGNQVQAGQPLMSIVPLDPKDIWITANYKETQLKNVRAGQRVRIRVDAYPDLRFTGRVDTIMAGTGSAFSLFPAENATGNYVKVVQRVPVKIVIEHETDAGRPLRIGMSVVPTILVDR